MNLHEIAAAAIVTLMAVGWKLAGILSESECRSEKG